jgi:hypothetical protein
MIEALSLDRLLFTAIVLAVAIYLSLFFYCAMIAHSRRKRAFARRPITTFQEWCRRHYADLSEREWQHVEVVVRVFAQEIGVHLTQLEPGDLVLQDYCLKGICSHFDDTWEAWTEKLGNYVGAARGHELSREESHLSSSWVTLDDVIRGTVALLGRTAATP